MPGAEYENQGIANDTKYQILYQDSAAHTQVKRLRNSEIFKDRERTLPHDGAFKNMNVGQKIITVFMIRDVMTD